MATLYDNLQGGTITNNPLTSGGTTLNSAALANLVAVTGADVLYITLDPDGTNGAPEIVKVTAHTASATSATIVRAQQGTTARSHPLSSKWLHGITESDLQSFLTSVSTANIVDANVTTAKIADSNVTTAKIADANVTAAKLASNSVATANIIDANVTTAKIADSAVTNAKLGPTWTTFTPTFVTNGYSVLSLGNGTMNARHLRMGNLGFISIQITTGSTTLCNSRSIDFDLPAGWTAAGPAMGRAWASFAANSTTAYFWDVSVGDTILGYSTQRGSTTKVTGWFTAGANSYGVMSQYGYVVGLSDNTAGQSIGVYIGGIPLT